MRMLPFLLLTTAGSLLWNTLLVTAGAVAGASWERVLTLLQTYSDAVILSAGLLALLWGVHYFRRES